MSYIYVGNSEINIVCSSLAAEKLRGSEEKTYPFSGMCRSTNSLIIQIIIIHLIITMAKNKLYTHSPPLKAKKKV
jgi:hypothetical protein